MGPFASMWALICGPKDPNNVCTAQSSKCHMHGTENYSNIRSNCLERVIPLILQFERQAGTGFK